MPAGLMATLFTADEHHAAAHSELDLIHFLQLLSQKLFDAGGPLFSYEPGRHCSAAGAQAEPAEHAVSSPPPAAPATAETSSEPGHVPEPAHSAGCHGDDCNGVHLVLPDGSCHPSFEYPGNGFIESISRIHGKNFPVFTYGSLMDPASAAKDDLVPNSSADHSGVSSPSSSDPFVKPYVALGLRRAYDFFESEEHVRHMGEKYGHEKEIEALLKSKQVGMLDVEPVLPNTSSHPSGAPAPSPSAKASSLPSLPDVVNGGVFHLPIGKFGQMMEREQGYDLIPSVVLNYKRLLEFLRDPSVSATSQHPLGSGSAAPTGDEKAASPSVPVAGQSLEESHVVDSVLEKIRSDLHHAEAEEPASGNSDGSSGSLASIAYTFSLPRHHAFKDEGVKPLPFYAEGVLRAVEKSGELVCSGDTSPGERTNCDRASEGLKYQNLFNATTAPARFGEV